MSISDTAPATSSQTIFWAESLAGKVAIVTGAAGEIGRVIASNLLAAGASVVWVGRHERALQEAVRQLHEGADRSLVLRADVQREPDVRRMVRTALKRFGRIDILVNNAGRRGPTLPITELSQRAWNEIIETNLTGPFLCARECLKHMMRQRTGRIINISSMAGRMPYPLRVAYASSKWGLIGLTITLAVEAGGANIQVNALCPGPVDGAVMNDVITRRARAIGLSPRTVRERLLRYTALRRMVTPSDVSRTVLFLCSEEARNITGQAIEVSAGFGLWAG